MTSDKYKPKKNHKAPPHLPPIPENIQLLRAIAEKLGVKIE
ncbi:unnamed protein product [marine sediment metagenome]|uniref:Uncharacterized protein n=1 Tax=marine sediment metagenome TaxID=412755 RepID=X1JX63_9ZZZZ